MGISEINDIVAHILVEFAEHLDTRAIVSERGALGGRAQQALRAHLPQGPWLLAVDENTWRVAGVALTQGLDALGQAWTRYDVPTEHGHKFPMCDDAAVEAFEAALEGSDHVAGVAIGSGTINDIVKLACHRRGLPMACIGTAPSMNGYTSKIAAVLSHGVKTTIPCSAPRVVVADLDVMSQSPERMIASGLGDLISKPVSNADWQLSASLNGTFHSADAMRVIEQGAAMLDGVAPKLPQGDREAMAGLVGSLMLSGLAMSIAGSSSPASGGEHLISHYIDMTAHAFDQPYDFHGCQVGVGTLTTALMYERLKEMDPASIDVEARVAALPAWEDWDKVLQERHTALYKPVVKHARRGYPDADTLRARLTTLKEGWPEIMERVSVTLRTQSSIEAELRQARGPVRFHELDVERERARRCIAWSKDIRNRYTILHLAWELGTLEAWTDEALELLC